MSSGTSHRGSRGLRSSSSRSSSVIKFKAQATLARRKVEMKYASLEAQRNLELAQAEVDAIKAVELEERTRDLRELSDYEETSHVSEARTRDYVLSLPVMDGQAANQDLKVTQGQSDSAGGASCVAEGSQVIRKVISSNGMVEWDSANVAGEMANPRKVIQGHQTIGGDQGTSTPINPFVPDFEVHTGSLQTPRIIQGHIRIQAPENTVSHLNPFTPCREVPAESLSIREVIQGHDVNEASKSRIAPTNPFIPYAKATTVAYEPPSNPARYDGIAEAITKGMEAGRLPTPSLKVFAGNALEWPTWKASFESVIERRTTNASERILYLLQYLDGEPRKIVEGYQFVRTDRAYTEAKTTLEKRFGHPSVVAEAFRKKLEGWKKIPTKDGPALREYSDFLKTCELAMQTVEDLQTLNNQHENRELLRVLPAWMYPKWGVKVKDYQAKHGDNKFPPFSDFVKFVTESAEVQCLPILAGLDTARSFKDQHGTKPKPQERRTLNTGAKEAPKEERKISCVFCSKAHELDACKEFTNKPIKEKTKFIIRKGLCLKCLEHGHMAKQNKCKKTLLCRHCKKEHPTCLHRSEDEGSTTMQEPNQGEAAAHCTGVCSVEGQSNGQDQSLIVPVWISYGENPYKEILTYALLDSQSNATFITESLCRELDAVGVESNLLLSTMHQENKPVDCQRINGLKMADRKREVFIDIPKAFSRDKIPCKPSQIPKPEVASQWEHLKGIAEEIMPYREDLQVGLLVGTDCLRAIKPREVIPGGDNDPYGVRTDLGWGIVGRVCRSPPQGDEEIGSWANRVVTQEVENVSCRGSDFVYETCAKEVFTPQEVNRMFEVDFNEVKGNEKPLSMEDRQFLELLDSGIHKRDDGHYEMPLPLRTEAKLPNNRPLAHKRLMHLGNRLKKDDDYRSEYTEYMDKMITECAEEVPPEDHEGTAGKVNYVPHHGVKSQNKSLRVVFDCSARYGGTSLNQSVLQGPDLTNNLVGILCRFREDRVAFSCDVQGMFNQFYVNEQDRDLLRFLWFKDGDVDSEPLEYRMKVHVFGAASSPGCANYGLKKAADDGEAEYGTEAAEFIKRDFYVDDGLKSVSSSSHAVQLIEKCRMIGAEAGLKLHKFVSNSREVIEAVLPEDRAKGLQDVDLKRDPLPLERTLGIVWCIELDCLQFRIAMQDRPLTRRGVLSTVSSVYDPLGLVAPVILGGKQILQELCRENAEWDDPIPEELRPRWEQWKNELSTLEEMKIRRCYKPEEFGELQSVELHHFSDASQSGYGQCSYLRLKDDQGRVSCSLVMAKARVAPLKQVSIPRLELTAAVVSVRVSQWLRRELNYTDIIEHFWTDSQVVLGYVNNNARRFHVYVANRVQEIRDSTDPRQWHYVESAENPADDASRGLRARHLVDNTRWLQGPKFLWSTDVDPGTDASGLQLDPDDPEVRRITTLAAQTTEVFPNHFETSRLDRFSDWLKAKTAIAVCLKLKSKLMGRQGEVKEDGEDSRDSRVSLEDTRRAEEEIIRCVQYEHFREEIELLEKLEIKGEYLDRSDAKSRNTNMKQRSNLYRLDPYLDEKGLLRVGGRLRNATMEEGAKHPLILSRKSHVTELIIRYCHQATKHQGLGMTHNELRQRGYWVIGGISAVSSYIHKCVTCKKLRAEVQQQKMADLPSDRTDPAPPFAYSAVDYFGPFIIKEGRKELKRYGVLFTCMASRAVHLETANSLETDAFINALRRFQAERGPIRQMRSDRGTNFVGAKNELREALKELDQEKIRYRLFKENCEWIEFNMNPPAASHMGGIWERQIKTVRSVLAGILEESGSQLDDESFRTLMKEVQSIVNSRPLSVSDAASPDNPDPLTPNHILTMKTKVLMPPPGVFLREDLYLKRRWRRVQHLANQFWERWRKEYLQTLQCRKKWQRPRRNMQVDDIVLVLDENRPRNNWTLAKVCETYPSKDGLVRKVKVVEATADLDSKGRRSHELRYLERPVQKLVLLKQGDQGIPDEEP